MNNVGEQRGFVLITVVVAITLVAAVALALSLAAVNETRVASGGQERDQLRYVVEAAMAHATQQLNSNATCSSYADIPSTVFGNHSYSVTVSPSDGSPVTLSATGQLQSGATATLTDDAVRVFMPSQTRTFQPGAEGKDSFIEGESGHQDHNKGDNKDISTDSESAKPYRGLLQFDLSSLPADIRVVSALLELYVDESKGISDTVWVHSLTNDWVESEVTWLERATGQNWTAAGGDFVSAAAGSFVVDSVGWKSAYVDSLVQRWVDAPTSNYGLALLSNAASGDNKKRYVSSDGDDASLHPKLTITYACECGTTCPETSTEVAPFAHWMLDDASGPIATDSEGDNDAFLMNGAVWATGQDGGALDFDGNNDYLVVPNSDVLPLTSKFTAAAWVLNEALSFSDTYRIFSNESSSSNGDFWVGISAGALWVGVGGEFFSPVFSLSPDTWYHIAVTFDEASDSLKVYVDGVLLLDATSSVDLVANGAPFYIGSNIEATKHWDGLIDDVRIYDQVLDADDIAALVQATDGSRRLVFVVSNDGSLSGEETAYQTLFESWGYTVQLLDDGASQADYDAASVANAVVFISARVSDTNVSAKLVSTPVGVVFSEANLTDEFGVAADTRTESQTAISIDESHYITEPFALGSLTTSSSAQSVAYLDGAVASGLSLLASSTSGSALVTLDVGAAIYNGSFAAGRRVQFPWSSSSFDPTSLNDDGQTLLRRSLEWAAGAGGASIANGLIAHWKFDETSGTVANDSVGGHHGTLQYGPQWTSGQINNALEFDGLTEHVEVNYDENLTLLEQMTLTAWIRPASGSLQSFVFQPIVNLDDGGLFSNYWLGTLDADIGFVFWSDGYVYEVFSTGDLITENNWHHVAASFDVTSNTLKLYVDGVMVRQAQITEDPSLSIAPVRIGNSIEGDYWDGLLDDVRIYNTVLDPSAIAVLAGGSGSGGGGGGGGSGGSSCNGTFRDEFNSQTFSGNDGTLTWSTDWLEVGESNGATSGDIRVMTDLSSYQLRTRDNDNGGEGAEREADVSGATSVSLSYDYSRVGLDNSSDYTSVQISSNGSAGPWTELARHQGPGTDNDYVPIAFDITAYASSTTRVRFITSSSMGGSDAVFFDNVEIACSP